MSIIFHHQLSHRDLAFCWSHSPTRQPLVVLHGLGDSAIHTYAPRFATSVLKNTPSLFIDLPGFGAATASDPYPATIEAMADDVADLLSTLDVENAPIFAHSMGANIAISLLYTHPRFASRFMAAEPLLHPEHSVLATGIARFSEEAFISRRYEMLVRATSLQTHRGDVAAAAFLPTLKLANPTMMYRAAASLVQERDPDFEAMLLALNVPCSLLIGERTNVDVSGLERAGIQVTRIRNSGHSMMAEQASSTAYAILKLVN